MTEKRFKLDSEAGFIDTQKCDEDAMTLFEVVVELNKLNEKNRQLKMGIESLKILVQNWEALDDEKDEQLDRQNQALKKLRNENEQLYELIDFANILISFNNFESCQKEWKKRLKELRE